MSLAAVQDGIPPALDLDVFECPHCGVNAEMEPSSTPAPAKPLEGPWIGFAFTTCGACRATAAWTTALGYTDEGVGIVDPADALLIHPR